MGHVRRARLAVASPFDLRLAVHGHGWVSLEPHSWDDDGGAFSTVVTHQQGGPTDVVVTGSASGLALRFESHRPFTPARVAALRRTVRSMLRLDEDLHPFWQRCRSEPRLRWVARRGAGRIMRSASLFEDLMKLLFTTNCSWSATEKMTHRLVTELGAVAPSGRRSFPDATTCAAQPESFFREQIRVGYRAASCARLARTFASGRLRDQDLLDPEMTTDELRQRLLALPGFGPYAAGQALRLLGRHDDLALDSWCRNRIAALLDRPHAPTDRSIERRYAQFAEYKGLAMWMELTASWHGE